MNEKKSRTAYISAVLSVIAGAILFGSWIVIDIRQAYWPRIIEEHFAAIIGLPMAGVAAFIVVVLLKQTSGNEIEFEGMGFKFKGPSGEVVLWIICFAVIALAIKLLW